MAWSSSHLRAAKMLGVPPLALKKAQLFSLTALGALIVAHPTAKPTEILAEVITDMMEDLHDNDPSLETVSKAVL